MPSVVADVRQKCSATRHEANREHAGKRVCSPDKLAQHVCFLHHDGRTGRAVAQWLLTFAKRGTVARLTSTRGRRTGAGNAVTSEARTFAEGVLRQSQVIGRLPAETLSRLLDRMTQQRCAPGQVLVRMNTPANHLLILFSGECIAAQAQVGASTTLQVRPCRRRRSSTRREAERVPACITIIEREGCRGKSSGRAC